MLRYIPFHRRSSEARARRLASHSLQMTALLHILIILVKTIYKQRTFRECQYFVVNLRSLCSSKDSILGCMNITVSNVVKNSIVEKNSILRNNANISSQRRLLDLLDILSINVNVARVWIVKTEQQTKNSRFSGERMETSDANNKP